MRAGPSTADLAAGLSVGARVSSYRAGRVLATGIPAAGVLLEETSGRTVPGSLTFEAPVDWTPTVPLSPLAVFGQRVLVDVVCRATDGREWVTPLGQFPIVDWEPGDDALSVTCNDLMRRLEDDPMAWPSSPPRGATVRSELLRLAGTVPVVLDDGVPDSAVASSSQWGNSRTEAVQKLASSKGFGIRSGPDGCLHAYPLRDASKPDVIYTAASVPGGNGLLVEAPPVAGERRPNRWIVTGTSSQGGKDTKWTAVRTNTSPPFDVAGYGWVTNHQEFSAADSRSAVEKAADTYMRNDLSAVVSRSITIVPDPRVERGDIVGVVTPDETFTGRVTAYSMPISEVGSVMRIDLDVLEW